MNLDQFFQRIWKDRNVLAYGLWPISLLYSTVVEIRRLGFSTRLLAVEKFSQPVVVIGNLSVGGTGKTPLTIWAANFLKSSGFFPGIVSRGYGRGHPEQTHRVNEYSTADEVGDEPLLIWRATQVPVAVAPRRADAIRKLMKESDCNIFLSDDGLQHLSLSSDLKIAVIDGQERFGNGFCLPAGPLRERAKRIDTYDLKIASGTGHGDEYSMDYRLTQVVNLQDSEKIRRLDTMIGKSVYAFAGIRHPDRFFEMLAVQGIESENYHFPDHHEFSPSDFEPAIDQDAIVLMTEKDAVKCSEFAAPNWWYVKAEVTPDSAFQKVFADKVAQLTRH